MERLNALLCGFFIFAFLLLAGCSSKTATGQPESGPGGSESTLGAGNGGKGAQPGTARQTPTGPSSLEQAQKGKPTDTPLTSPLKEIYFGFDSFDLNPEARAILKTNADWLKANPSVRVEVEGHCDERGTNEYNLALGAKRAQSAKDYLVTLGIATDRLSTISYGEELPVCKENTEACWQKNRRGRFVITTGRPAS
jgi:peptidoglycan-associated lipoprotein